MKLDGLASGRSVDRLRRYVDVANGTIKRLVRDRGFGFIRDDGGQEWFFQRVSFDEEPSAKGPRAGNIRTEA
jgi:cold shock CspA family protein